jgi:hypothetical protein
MGVFIMALLCVQGLFNDISWAQAYNNNTLLLAAIKYKKDKEHRLEKVKGKRVFFLKLPISNVNKSVLPRSLELRGDFQTHRQLFSIEFQNFVK